MRQIRYKSDFINISARYLEDTHVIIEVSTTLNIPDRKPSVFSTSIPLDLIFPADVYNRKHVINSVSNLKVSLQRELINVAKKKEVHENDPFKPEIAAYALRVIDDIDWQNGVGGSC